MSLTYSHVAPVKLISVVHNVAQFYLYFLYFYIWQMKRDPCKELWCSRLSFSTYNNRYCQTRRTAALEGTKCGVNKVGSASRHST